ncbi:WD40-repeat-containing domain protein [Phlebopus sp. FC_14]|nr:WD40-repeat-containing domain protein [Phlebopus sp. FC_14]
MCKLQVSTAYISASTNRFSHAAHVSPSASLVAFGTGRLVALWNIDDPTDCGVHQTLPGHDGLVTCIQFVRDDLFVSADDKGAVRCWQKLGKWESTCLIQAHQQPVSALAVSEELLVTGSSDSSVKIWSVDYQRENGQYPFLDKFQEIQSIPLQGRYPLAIAISYLPQSKAVILAIAGTDRNVNIWTRSESLFVHCVTLPGHEDWVRALAFHSPVPPQESDASNSLILASGSQDGTIRLWNIEVLAKSPDTTSSLLDRQGDRNVLSDALLDAFEASLADPTEGEEGGRQISLKSHVLSVKSKWLGTQQYAITFDALLIGHEAGVTSLSWAPTLPDTASTSIHQTLLSTSTDSSLILWSPSNIYHSSSSSDSTAGSIWVNRQRFGDVGGQRLGGFVGGFWAQTKKGGEALAWGWSGGWRRWRSTEASRRDVEEWGEVGAIGGHKGPIRDLDWSPCGEYLISVGLDQTTRIHGGISSPIPHPAQVWHELARPQVHGYDLVGVTWLSPWTFASVADEKVARIFEAPRGFVEIVKSLHVKGAADNTKERPLAASVPPLGLSNKAISDVPPPLDPSSQYRRPFEGELATTTLWPEVEKLFGHGYESITLATSTLRDLLATACRATSAQHAVVRVYSASTYRPFGSPLEGHTLTVTRIAFSPDDRYIVTVSRDRTWRAFERKGDNYLPAAADKSHGRIIWDCAWSREGDIFATASRDKTVKIWIPKSDADRWSVLTTLQIKDAATAVAFCSLDGQKTHDRRFLAIGLETGEILIYSGLRSTPEKWTPVLSIERECVPHTLARMSSNEPLQELHISTIEDGTLRVLIVQVGID